jgi:hypothetical protein
MISPIIVSGRRRRSSYVAGFFWKAFVIGSSPSYLYAWGWEPSFSPAAVTGSGSAAGRGKCNRGPLLAPGSPFQNRSKT